MKTQTELLRFLENFFSKLESFPPGPGVVTYDRLVVRYQHPQAQLRLEGATCVARCMDTPGDLHLRLAFELGDAGGAHAPIKLSLKDNFQLNETDHFQRARDNLLETTERMLSGFQIVHGTRRNRVYTVPAAAGQ